MYQWYAVQVMSGHEKKVKKAILENREAHGMIDLISDVMVPTENVSEVKKGQQRITEKRLWPGYILVQMNLTDDSWAYIKNTNDVIDFLGGGKPSPLSDKEVEEIFSDIEKKKSKVVHKYGIDIGDTVKINDGVFVNFIGTVVEVFHDKGRLNVRVSIFGRDTQVDDLEFWQVEKVTSDTEL